MDGDELTAFTLLYERHATAVHRYASRRCEREAAEEVVAQVFAIAWRRRDSLPQEPLPWLYGAARRVLAEQRRSQLRRRKLYERLRSQLAPEGAEDDRALDLGERDPSTPSEANRGPRPADDSPPVELSDPQLASALRRLRSGDREALLLTYWEELSPAQAAQAMGCSRPALAVRLHRARRRLRKQLESERARLEQPHGSPCVTETESI
jgi:RNA polymerase sigma-70 factor (ECF subfamily)